MKAWGFIGETYPDIAVNIDAQRTENLIPRVQESRAGKVVSSFVKAPGTRVFVSGLDGAVRGELEHNGRAFCVAGTKVYEITWDGVAGAYTEIDEVAYDWRDAQMVPNGPNGQQVLIKSGGLLYVLDLDTTTLTAVGDGGGGLPAVVVAIDYLDGYFAALHGDYQTFGLSNLNNGLVWAGDNANKTITADRLMGIRTIGRSLRLYGAKRIEDWYNTGDTFPLAPAPDTLLDEGLEATFAQCKIGETPFWLGAKESGGRILYAGIGGGKRRLSTLPIENEWQKYLRADDAYMWPYEMGGQFVNITFPDANKTWSFDLLSNMWHERSWRNPETKLQEAHLARSHMRAFGKHLVGSRRDGVIYELTPEVFSDAGEPLRWMRRAPYISDERGTIIFNRLVLDINVGDVDLDVDEPHVMMRYSDDAVKTWSNESWRSLGARGDYGLLVQWDALGSGTQRCFELSGSAPVMTGIADAYIDAERGID